ncbi:MAG: polyribonucleotide nucleotidyltransferase [Patescibacteria group bacterium]
MKTQEFSIKVGDKTLKIEKNILAEQANGAILITSGETTVLCTAVMGRHPSNLNYFPLNVEYQEKYYASGKIPGSFFKREGKSSDTAVLKSRLIDRCLRPLFDHGVKNSIQIIASVLSSDIENDADILAMNGASLALTISDIPFMGPLGAVRIGRVNGNFVLNPTEEERKNSDLDLIVAGTKDRINMVEAGANQVPESELVKAFQLAQDEITKIVIEQEKITKNIGKKKVIFNLSKPSEELIKDVKSQVSEKIEDFLYNPDKLERMHEINEVKNTLLKYIKEKYPENPENTEMSEKIFEDEIDYITHKNILEKGRRSDGRKPAELRAIETEAGLLARTHGSGFFKRGSTQALTILTLGDPLSGQIIDTMDESYNKKFMHHYNFPPFSVGETGPLRGPSRRDIGHGSLAERALKAILPSQEEFPYTIRLVSEILSSNGSSSMASVCGSSLALMDGGVPIKKIAAGIAMGLMTGKNGEYVVLTDIQGPEDHHGDMDFKAAGTDEGITALQMDVKIDGVTIKMLEDTLKQAKEARLEIIEHIKKTISEPRSSLSKYAPKIETIKIDPKKIGLIIGSGGKTINGIIETTGAKISLEDDGSVFISSTDVGAIAKAKKIIEGLVKEPKEGEIYSGVVTKTTDFGAFVQILPGKEGLIHISNLKKERVKSVEEVVRRGDTVKVKIMNVDPSGKIQLSMKDIE